MPTDTRTEVVLPLPNSTALPTHCGAVIDRHTPKSAGTSVRSLLQRNAKLGACDYVGYDVSRSWESRVGFRHHNMSELVGELSRSSGTEKRKLCIEAHIVGGKFWTDIDMLRASSFALRCRVVVMVRVREPLSWYRSYYNWGVRSHQRVGDARWGNNFTDWLPHNMQCKMLMMGTAGRGTQTAEQIALKPKPTASPALSAKKWHRVYRVLKSADVVAPLEWLDESLSLLARRAPGFLSTLSYRRTKPRDNHGPWEKEPMVAEVGRAEDQCSPGAGLKACKDAVRRAAPDDVRLYKVAVQMFEAQLVLERLEVWPMGMTKVSPGVLL